MPSKLLTMDQSKFRKIKHGCQNDFLCRKRQKGTVEKKKKKKKHTHRDERQTKYH